MKRPLRRALVVAVLGLVACAPLIGLDELHDKVADAGLPDVGPTPTIDAGDAGDAGPAGQACAKHKDCNPATQTGVALCVDARCVPVNRDYCRHELLPSKSVLQEGNPFIVAAFTTIKQDAPLATAPGLAFNLALEEIAKTGSGIPLEPRRDMVVMLCASEPDVSEQALKHVVNDLKIQAVIANFSNDTLPKYVKDITLPAGTFVLNANGTPESLKYLNTKNTVLNLLGTSEDLALSYKPLIEELSKAARARKDAGASEPIKVSLLITSSFGEEALSVVITSGAFDVSTSNRDAGAAISINGITPAQADAATFQSESFPPSKEPQVQGLGGRVATFAPDIVIALTQSEIGELVQAVENAIRKREVDARDGGGALEAGTFDGGGLDGKLPIWALGPRNYSREEHLKYLDTGDFFEARNQRLSRFWGIQYAGSPTTYKAWLQRMDDRYDKGAGRPVDYAANENPYDAIYWLAYGLFRGKLLDPTAPDGKALAEGVRELFAGSEIVTPPQVTNSIQEISSAFIKLRGGPVTFVGALGPPNIDRQYNTWRGVGTAYCYGKRTIQGGPEAQFDVRRYLPDGGVQVRTDLAFECPFPPVAPLKN